MIAAALLALCIVNLLTIWSFRADKARAAAGAWRIPEANLLALAFVGGTPGTFIARRWFRHKTRKQPFSTQLWLIAAVQAGVGASFLFR